VAYFLSPSAPEFELVETQLRDALAAACGSAGIQSRLERAVTSARPSIVHDEIWNALYHADLLVFDVTGYNPSVMMELGVGAAWRQRPHVIVLQNSYGESRIPFNLMPARVLRYKLTPAGLARLRAEAQEAFLWSLSTLPVARRHDAPVFPFQFPRHIGQLHTPSLCHRYLRPDGRLEFGAPHRFLYSFVLPNTGPLERVRLQATVQFFDPQPDGADPPWIGFKLLGNGVLMNHGVGAVVRSRGQIQVTYQESENGPYRDPEIGQIPRFNPERDLVTFWARVSAQVFSIRVTAGRRRVSHQLNLVRTAGYRPASGYCLVQAFRSRAILHSLRLTP
jgi:hypothetical protein